jgi:Spy/CpxP family protein refolding chaperone
MVIRFLRTGTPSMLKQAPFIFTVIALILLHPGFTTGQALAPGPSGTHSVKHTAPSNPQNDFAGLTFTDEQKAKIAQIQGDMKPRMDTVAKDKNLTPEQKGAMLDGYHRMEQQQIFAVLTPEQQTEVRKKMVARRSAEREKTKPQQPVPRGGY